RIVAADGQPPARVAIIHCVGSRSAAFNPYCSGVCCGVSVKHAHQIKDQLPDAHVHLLFSDLCLPGKIAQSSFGNLQAMPDVHLHRVNRMDTLHIHLRNGTPVVHYTTGRPEVLEVDLAILATAMEAPVDTAAMAACLDIERDEHGFFKEAHSILEPVTSSREGIYLAGCCQGPKDIAASVAQGQAAAGRILQRLVPGAKRVLDPQVARVDGDICSGCRTCASICPFGAMGSDPQNGGTVVQEILCRGCGICAAACPSGAITVGHFERDAVNAEIDGLLGGRDRMPDAR
ncbi:MAG: 4Fe-4S dicluster domain-containing protein, partial [Desulfovibrionaceae bacterium]